VLKSASLKRYWPGLLILTGLAVGSALLGWLLAYPPGGRVPAPATQPLQASETAPAQQPAVAPNQPVTHTLHLPWAVHNDRPGPPVFGIELVQSIDAAHGLDQAVDARMHWLRFHTFGWDAIEPVRTDPPTYDWSSVDEQSLINATNQGFQVIAPILHAPNWAQKLPGVACGPIKQASLDEFAEFLEALVGRYSAPPYSIHYWELGNEPDVDPALVPPDSAFGCWGDAAAPFYGGQYYAEMLKVAYPAIKAADPNAQVLIGGLLLDCDPGNPPPDKDCSPARFLEGILFNDGGPYFDIVSFHAYSYHWLGGIANPNWPGSVTALPEKTAFLRNVLDQYGFADKVLMNTESALLCFEDTADCRQVQADFVPRAYAEAMALGLKAQIYYALISNWRYTGLLDADLNPHPAYDAYVAATTFLTSARYQGEVSGYPAGIEGYRFQQRGQPIYVDLIWAADGAAHNVTLPAGATAYDKFGQLLAGSGDIVVGSSPVYVRRSQSN
jgi:hypothetical protein